MDLIIALIIMLPAGPEVVTDIPTMAICHQERDAFHAKNIQAVCVKDTRMMIEMEVAQIEKIIEERNLKQEVMILNSVINAIEASEEKNR
jgi:lipoprotein NlpI